MGFVANLLQLNQLYQLHFLKPSQIDAGDQLTWQLTANLLIVLMFVVSNAKTFVNKVISCAVPINFSPNQEEYANEVCYISDKYYVIDNERIFVYQNRSNDIQINYVLNYVDTIKTTAAALTTMLGTSNNNNASSAGTISSGNITNAVAGSAHLVPTLVSYYVWIPYVLLVQIGVLLLPERLWLHLLDTLTAIDMAEFLKAARRCECEREQRTAVAALQSRTKTASRCQGSVNFQHLVSHINRAMLMPAAAAAAVAAASDTATAATVRKKSTANDIDEDIANAQSQLQSCGSSRFAHTKLFAAYLLIKVANVAGVLVQITLINYLLGINLYEWLQAPRVNSLAALLFVDQDNDKNSESDKGHGTARNDTSTGGGFFFSAYYFPLKSMCTFRIRELATTNTYAIMCSLPINLFVQYVFVLLSLWYLLSLAVNLYCTAAWLAFARTQAQLSRVRRRLRVALASTTGKNINNNNNQRHYSSSSFASFSSSYYSPCCGSHCTARSEKSFNDADATTAADVDAERGTLLTRRHRGRSLAANNEAADEDDDERPQCDACARRLRQFVFEFGHLDFWFLLEIVLANSSMTLLDQLLANYWRVFCDNNRNAASSPTLVAEKGGEYHDDAGDGFRQEMPRVKESEATTKQKVRNNTSTCKETII